MKIARLKTGSSIHLNSCKVAFAESSPLQIGIGALNCPQTPFFVHIGAQFMEWSVLAD
jgi:hypothetical protein